MKHCQICSEGDNTLHGHFPFMHVAFDNAFRFVEDEVRADMRATAVGNERDKRQLTKLIPTEFFKNDFSFMTLFSTLVRCGTAHPTGVLEFCQCVGDLLDRNAQFMSNAEVLWRLWSIVANTLQEHISKVGP